VLGIGIEDVDIKRVDTAFTPADPGSYGSRVTVLAGEAAINAAEDAKQQLREFAAKKLGAMEDEIVFKDKQVCEVESCQKHVLGKAGQDGVL
jgi:CO/xanthine dehydrogenase Mo-binding subunit